MMKKLSGKSLIWSHGSYSGILLFSFILIGFISCNPLNKRIEGNWTVNSAKNGSNDVLLSLYSNIISFEKDSCFLPVTTLESNDKGVWNVIEIDERNYLIIEAPGNFLTGKYLVEIKKDNNTEIPMLYLKSPELEVVATKLFPY